MGTLSGLPIIRTRIFWGLYWGSPFRGNHQFYRVSQNEYPRGSKYIPNNLVLGFWVVVIIVQGLGQYMIIRYLD